MGSDSSVRLHVDRGVIVLAKAAAVQVARATSSTLIEKGSRAVFRTCGEWGKKNPAQNEKT